MARKQTSYENVIANFFPALRFRAANIMAKEYGVNQQESAQILGVTQASINKYLSGKISYDVKATGNAIDNKAIHDFVDYLLSGKERQAKEQLCRMCQMYKSFDCSLMVKQKAVA
ncbi:MAG: hypothetical protein QXN59_00505 [Candidatus Micrarchaeaceae archaeon]